MPRRKIAHRGTYIFCFLFSFGCSIGFRLSEGLSVSWRCVIHTEEALMVIRTCRFVTLRYLKLFFPDYATYCRCLFLCSSSGRPRCNGFVSWTQVKIQSVFAKIFVSMLMVTTGLSTCFGKSYGALIQMFQGFSCFCTARVQSMIIICLI